jgi:hypothetical protein
MLHKLGLDYCDDCDKTFPEGTECPCNHKENPMRHSSIHTGKTPFEHELMMLGVFTKTSPKEPDERHKYLDKGLPNLDEHGQPPF